MKSTKTVEMVSALALGQSGKASELFASVMAEKRNEMLDERKIAIAGKIYENTSIEEAVKPGSDLHNHLDKVANGGDEVSHEGHTYRRSYSEPKSGYLYTAGGKSRSKTGPWRKVKK